MSINQNIKVFATQPHPCSYLPEQMATTLFIDPNIIASTSLYSHLSDLGFRRSGSHIYKPHCELCEACIPVRLSVNDFDFSRSQKRVLKKNAEVAVSFSNAIDDEEYYDLFAKYIELQHADGDMYPANREQYDNFLNCQWDSSRFITFRQQGKLIAVAVTDFLEQGLSAIYTFYDPTLTNQSLGTFCILQQILYTQQNKLDYLYLGYWIEQSPKMAYKSRFQPLQKFIDGQWQ